MARGKDTQGNIRSTTSKNGSNVVNNKIFAEKICFISLVLCSICLKEDIFLSWDYFSFSCFLFVYGIKYCVSIKRYQMSNLAFKNIK